MIVNYIIMTMLFVNAIDLINLEPDIQCTIVEVHKNQKFIGLKDFPRTDQSINNDPKTSRLFIAGKELVEINPKTISKNSTAETIFIESGKSRLVLELKGKPISRRGLLKIDGTKIATLTCH
jgi:hypothetical protein